MIPPPTKHSTKSKSSLQLGLCFLGLLTVICVAACIVQIDRFPPYIDPDTATDGIFLNNLILNQKFDYPFSQTPGFQNQYRSWYAAQRLPIMLPLSILAKNLIVAPLHTLLFLQITSVLLAIAGCWIFCLWVLPEEFKRWEKVALSSWSLAFPAFFVPLRLSFPYWFLAFFLFWAVIGALLKFSDSKKPRYLYVISLAIAYFLLNPYPPLIILAVCILFIAAKKRLFRSIVVNPHAYGAAILGGLLIISCSLVAAKTANLTLPQYWSQVSNFHSTRAFSISDLPSASELANKSKKYIDQHVLFLRDNLGDQTRPDASETLGEIHWPALVGWAVILFSFGAAVRSNNLEQQLLLGVLGITLLIALTVSFPEGRYLLILVPIYGYLFLSGLRKIFPSETRRLWAVNIFLLCSAGYTLLAYTTQYRDYLLVTQSYQEGMKEIVEELSSLDLTDGALISKSTPLTYESWLVLGMLNNFKPKWIPTSEFFGKIDAVKQKQLSGEFYFVENSAWFKQPSELKALGFQLEKEFSTLNLQKLFRIWTLTLKR